MKRIAPLGMAAVLLATPACASELERFARQGYSVLETTNVQGEFKGCDFGRRIPLTDGLIFVCSGYNYSYSYGAEVLVLKSVRSGDIKILIDNEEYDGQLYRQAGQ